MKLFFFSIFTLTVFAGGYVSAQPTTFTIERTYPQDVQEHTKSAHVLCGLDVVVCEGEEFKPLVQHEVKKIVSKQDIENEIRRVFHDVPEEAIAIAKCESGMVPTKKGDGHLTIIHNGETLGSSHGIFQVRTGGQEKNGTIWNRAAANGMSVDAFISWMEDPKENIQYARDIYDRRGWSGWHNCAIKTGIYNKN